MEIVSFSLLTATANHDQTQVGSDLPRDRLAKCWVCLLDTVLILAELYVSDESSSALKLLPTIETDSSDKMTSSHCAGHLWCSGSSSLS